MAHRVLLSHKTINAGDMTQNSVTSDTTDVSYLHNLCVQVVSTGVSVGTLAMQATLDGTNWATVEEFGSLDVPAACNLIRKVAGFALFKIRFVYTKTSSSADNTITVTIFGNANA